MLKVLNFGGVIAIVWVDDIIIAGINTDVLRFKMKDLGVLSNSSVKMILLKGAKTSL